ncbi:MAG: OmpA family protein [Cellvibrionaceae bacterium]
MKKIVFISSLVAIAISNTPPSYAGETKTALKQAGVFSTSALLGAAAGGPLGLFLGAIGGAYLGEQIEKADKTTLIEKEISENTMYITQLEDQLAEIEVESIGSQSELSTHSSANSPANSSTNLSTKGLPILEKLEFQILFHTGIDTLSARGENRIATLASFLVEHPTLSIRLTGHADPRGTDEYNNVLSEHRAISVQHALESYGVESQRIERRAYGALQSIASTGNYEAYAHDRRVDIEIFNNNTEKTIAKAH